MLAVYHLLRWLKPNGNIYAVQINYRSALANGKIKSDII